MNARVFVFGVAVLILAGLACRWEEWSYVDRAGVSVFQYRGVLLPWQDVQAPPQDAVVASVTVRKWSYYGFNRFDYTWPPGAAPGPITRAAVGQPR